VSDLLFNPTPAIFSKYQGDVADYNENYFFFKVIGTVIVMDANKDQPAG
jgi:hypothetical protein